MKRIAIVGSGGAGKSTFSRELSRLTGLPLVHLDQHFWQPGWIETPLAKWRALQAELLAGDEWIADGNYNSTFDIRFGRADTVIVISLSRYRCLFRAFKRTWGNRGKCIQAVGCPERFEASFYKWIWNFPNEGQRSLDPALQEHRENLDVIVLRSPRQVREFLNSLS